jgi:hypothetical protein
VEQSEDATATTIPFLRYRRKVLSDNTRIRLEPLKCLKKLKLNISVAGFNEVETIHSCGKKAKNPMTRRNDQKKILKPIVF